jgi:hypothetical protein
VGALQVRRQLLSHLVRFSKFKGVEMFEGIPTFKATISHWTIKRQGEHHVIYGFTSEEPHFGTSIRTSLVELLNLKDGWVKTRNSFYKLGEMAEEQREADESFIRGQASVLNKMIEEYNKLPL